MKNIELLAPAGNMAALKAAVENGADAVYLGGEMFNARRNADNFGMEEMQAALDYAHARNCKVYVAVNILIHNEEIGAVLDYCYALYAMGADAVIVQDLGLLHLLREVLPELAVHASTQMVVHNRAGVLQLEAMGIKRVVLARETSLADIRSIREQTSAELEVFVHGALCVGYSGQCLMSSMIGGRSGNRGQCAQPCRMPYELLDHAGEIQPTDGRYLLSTRDLNMIEHLPHLIQAGIHSLKIEGRMKRPEYVATVVRHYRQALDACAAHEKMDLAQAQKELLQIFNRGFTAGYFFGNEGKALMSRQRPDNRGVLAAEVLQVQPKKVTLKLLDTLAVHDGYLLLNGNGEEIAGKIQEMWRNGKSVQSGEKGQTVLIGIQGNAQGSKKLYRTADNALLQRAAESYRQPSEPAKKVVHFKIELRLGKPISLLAWDEEGHQQYGESAYLIEAARTRPSDYEAVKKQLERLGNTSFVMGDLTAEIDEGIMAPASELNQLRRQVMEGLEVQLGAQKAEIRSYDDYIEDAGDFLDRIPPQVFGYTDCKLSVHTGSIAACMAAAEQGADLIYYNGTAWREDKPNAAAEYAQLVDFCHQKEIPLYWTCTPIVHEQHWEQTAKRMTAAKAQGFDGVLVGNLGLLQLAKHMDWQNVAADYPLNIFNDLTLQYLLEQEICRAALSPELCLEEIKAFSYLGNVPLELVAHGNFPLMISEQCVAGSVLGERTLSQSCRMPCLKDQYALKDRMDMQFPLRMDEHCRMYVYNSKVLNIYKRLEEVLQTGVDWIRIEGRAQDAHWVGTVTSIYRDALERYRRAQYKENQMEKEQVKAKREQVVDFTALHTLEQLSPQGSTYGHYFRGVL